MLGFVGGRHDVVSLRVAIKRDHMGELVPWHELNLTLVDDVLLVRAFTAREDVESNHASDQVGADVLLPGFLRTTESNLDIDGLACLQFQRVPGVEGPSDILLLLLVLLLVQMAASCSPLFPLTRNDLVSAVFELDDLHFVAAEHLQSERREILLVGRRWYDDEGTLRGLVERIHRCVLV